MDPVTQERIARNDHLFREANERIHAAAREHGLSGPVPFVCECADPACTELLRLTPAAYRDVRGDPRRFLVATGHEGAAGDAAEVVECRDGYEVVEKTGHAGEVAERLAEEGAS